MVVSRGKVFAIVTTCVIVAAAVISVVVWFQDGGTSVWQKPSPLNTRGLSYHKSGQYQLAIQDFDKAIRIDPIYVDAYVNRGWSYYKLGQTQLAIQDFDKAIQLDPNDYYAYGLRGIYYHDSRQYQRAIQDLDKAIKLAPSEWPIAYYYRGTAYHKTGRLAEGNADKAKACRLDSELCYNRPRRES